MTAAESAASSPKGPLSGITVVDLSRILAGPYCTLMMAELGARVIKVETPGTGDDARQFGPFKDGKSAYFMSINRGKESIALNLKEAGDKAVFDKLLGTADVVVENFRPGTMEKLGYGWDDLHARYPKLIYAAASGFGHSGPESRRPAYDMVVQGMGGIMSITGTPGGAPVRVGMSIGDIGAGLYTTIGVLSALHHRQITGEATKVDVAMFDVQLALVENAIMRYHISGKPPQPEGAKHPTITPFEAFDAQDGYIIIAAGNDNLFRQLCEALERPDLVEDPRFISNPARSDNQPALKEELEKTLRTKTIDAWQAILDKAGIPAGPINDVGRAVNHPQAIARNMNVTADDPELGTIKLVGNPIKISGFDDPSTRRPAPRLNEHGDEIRRQLG